MITFFNRFLTGTCGVPHDTGHPSFRMLNTMYLCWCVIETRWWHVHPSLETLSSLIGLNCKLNIELSYSSKDVTRSCACEYNLFSHHRVKYVSQEDQRIIKVLSRDSPPPTTKTFLFWSQNSDFVVAKRVVAGSGTLILSPYSGFLSFIDFEKKMTYSFQFEYFSFGILNFTNATWLLTAIIYSALVFD